MSHRHITQGVMEKFGIIILCLSTVAVSGEDDRIHFDESRWNTPPELTPEAAAKDESSPQPRFLPFSASFTLSAGGSNAHSLSVGGSDEGLSLSQSQSNAGSGISASQSSSFSAGLSGISASDANSFNLNHPAFGGHSQADSNSFALGQASASAQGNVVNNQATSVAQSSVDNAHSSAASGVFTGKPVDNVNGGNRAGNQPAWTNIGPNYEVGGLYTPRPSTPRPLRLNIDVDDRRFSSQRPQVFISDIQPPSSRFNPPTRQSRPFRTAEPRPQWTQSPLTGPSPQEWSQNPGLQISGASAASSASSNSPNGFALGQSSSHGGRGPASFTTNHAQSSGGGSSHAHGSAAAVGSNSGNGQGSFSSGAISATSGNGGHAQGTAHSGNRGGHSRGQVNSQSSGAGAVHGTANAGGVSFVRFPGAAEYQNIPREFLRSNSRGNSRGNSKRAQGVLDDFLTEVEDTVADIFDI